MGTERTDELYKVLLTKGYPKELCAEIAYKNLNTDYTATRMLGYLYRYTEPRLEDVIDEMIPIDIVNIGLHFFLKNVRPYAASCSEA